MCFPIPTQHEACGVFPWVMLRYQLSARTATFEPKPSSINTGSFVEHGTIRKCRSSPCLSVPGNKHGSLNVPIEHHPTIRYMVYNGYYKVMSNIPKMGQLPTPEQKRPVFSPELRAFCPVSQLVSPQNHGHGSPPTWRNLEHPRYVVPPKPEMFIG